MKMYVWTKQPFFIAVAQAESVDAARKRMLEEIGESGDGSCPERDKAREWIKSTNPTIWHGINAEFALTDSAEQIEIAAVSDNRYRALKALLDIAPFAMNSADAEIHRQAELAIKGFPAKTSDSRDPPRE